MRLEDLIRQIQDTYKFVGVSLNKKTGKKTYWTDDSMTILALHSDIDKLRVSFPEFNFSHIYGSYWLVYFKKPLDFIENSLAESKS
jgi:hypothetical protein